MFLKRALLWFLQKRRLVINRVRSSYWSFVCASVGSGLRVAGKILVDPPDKLFIGNDVVINEGVYINTRDRITLGNGVHLSPYVRINAGSLDLRDSSKPHLKQPVVIQDRAWIATGVIINPGVTIGEGCVVGAGAVVTRDLPPYTLCVGVPAKPIKDLPRP